MTSIDTLLCVGGVASGARWQTDPGQMLLVLFQEQAMVATFSEDVPACSPTPRSTQYVRSLMYVNGVDLAYWRARELSELDAILLLFESFPQRRPS